MSYYVLIRGPLGCGKSTIAEALAKALNAKYISIDDVLERHGLDKIDKGERHIPSKNFIKANELVIPAAKEALSKGRVVIFDACFYSKEPIEHLIKNLAYPNHSFTLKVPVEMCIERDSKRKRAYGEAAARAVHGLVSKFDYGIDIDATKSSDSAVDEILSLLPSKS